MHATAIMKVTWDLWTVPYWGQPSQVPQIPGTFLPVVRKTTSWEGQSQQSGQAQPRPLVCNCSCPGGGAI